MNRIERVREVVDEILLKMPNAQERRCAYIHLYGVAQACAILAKRRKENVELAVVAGMLHDISTYLNMDMAGHEHKGAIIAKDILKKLGIFAHDEVELICTAIYNHGEKADIHSTFDEILKDADVIQHTFYNPLLEVKVHERERYANIIAELDLGNTGV